MTPLGSFRRLGTARSGDDRRFVRFVLKLTADCVARHPGRMVPCRLAPLRTGIDDPFERLIIDPGHSQQIGGPMRITKQRTEARGRGHTAGGVGAVRRPIILPRHEGFRAEAQAADGHLDLSGADEARDPHVPQMTLFADGVAGGLGKLGDADRPQALFSLRPILVHYRLDLVIERLADFGFGGDRTEEIDPRPPPDVAFGLITAGSPSRRSD